MVFRHEADIGVDSKEGIVHSVCSTAASVSDIQMSTDLLHGEQKKVRQPTGDDLPAGTPDWGDAGYQGQIEVIHAAAPQARGHDLAAGEDQGRRGSKAEAQEPNQGTSESQSGVAVSRAEAGLRIHQGALSRLEKESRVASRGSTFIQAASGWPE